MEDWLVRSIRKLDEPIRPRTVSESNHHGYRLMLHRYGTSSGECQFVSISWLVTGEELSTGEARMPDRAEINAAAARSPVVVQRGVA
jgi:hypothetical protein